MKLQIEVLKAMSKSVKNHIAMKYYLTDGNGDGFTWGITDGHFIKFYPEYEKLINVTHESFRPDPIKTEQFIEEVNNATPATFTNELIKIDKSTCNVFALADGSKVYIDEKLLDLFVDKDIKINDLQFFCNASNKPLFIKRHKQFYGLILPVIVRQ